VLAVTLTGGPWFIRNYETFHKVIPFRSCLGWKFNFGNNMIRGTGDLRAYHPSDNEDEWGEYQQAGEIAYTQKKSRRAGIHPFASIVVCSAKRRGGCVTMDWFLEFEPALSARGAGRSL